MIPITADHAVVRVQRTIPASPARVYRAWLDPDQLRRWLAPAGLEVQRAEVEPRVGGRYRIWQAGADGRAGGFESELLELVPDRRLVFRWRFVGPDRVADPAHDSLLTVTLRDAPDGATELTLVHERLAALRAAMPYIADNVGVGWGMALDKLAGALAEATR
ncbi:MAG: SRPBCC family protein [Solirubrobacteraceae bacterium]